MIRWVAAALAIAGWQATTKRVADGAINNQPLQEEEEDLAMAAAPRRPAGGPPGGDRGPLSRGLFGNDLLGLYDNAGSF